MRSDSQNWIYQLCKGSEDAYRFFFEEYYQLLAVFALKYVKEKETAEDIVHDVILEFYTRKLKFESLPALKSYLYLSVKTHSLNYLRHAAAQNHYLQNASIQEKKFFLDTILEEEVYALLKKAISELPEKIRKIYELSLQGLSNDKIAEELSFTLDSVKAYKKRGKQILRKKLNGLSYLLFLIV